MRLIIQRVLRAKVSIKDEIHASINTGFLVLLGIEEEDRDDDISWSVAKLCNMRIFPDDEGKMNQNIKDVNGELLIVSQFTLLASTKKGNRPSFIKAARPELAIPLYKKFINESNLLLGKACQTGQFGADMQIELVNDGPVTIILDSKNRDY